MSAQIAFLGLGTMGSGMAANLLKAGHAVSVWNRTREKIDPLIAAGAKMAQTPAQAAADADVIFCMVTDDAASRAVWTGSNGALSSAAPYTLLVECSTISLQWSIELYALAADRNMPLLDAPVTGSKIAAEKGELTFLVGGDTQVFNIARPLLAAMGKNIFHIGPPSSGTKMKLVNNLLLTTQVVALAESLTLAQKSGLDLAKVAEVFAAGSVGSPAVKTMSQRMLTKSYAPNFSLALACKDLRYVNQLSTFVHAQLPVTDAVRERFYKANTGGNQDISGIYEDYH